MKRPVPSTSRLDAGGQGVAPGFMAPACRNTGRTPEHLRPETEPDEAVGEEGRDGEEPDDQPAAESKGSILYFDDRSQISHRFRIGLNL